MPKIKKYQNCKNDVYQPDEKGYPQTVFSHSAYSARTAHPFQRNGAPFRFKLSKARQVD